MKQPEWMVKIVVSASFLMVVSAVIDGWWHVAIGRDEFWIPPHVALYSSFSVVLLGLLYTSIRFRLGRKIESAALIGLGAIIVSAPFDDWWHVNMLPPGVVEQGLGFITPPHFLFFAGGVLAGWSVIRIVISQMQDNLHMKRYLYLIVLAGLMMFIQAMDTASPAYLGIAGDIGIILRSTFLVAFFVFIQNIFSEKYLVITSLAVGLEKTLTGMDLSYLISISVPGLLIALFGPVDSRRMSLRLGFISGILVSSFLWFHVDFSGMSLIAFKTALAAFSGSLGSLLGFILSFRYVQNLFGTTFSVPLPSQVKERSQA